jgi:hypothetical protein
MQAEGTHEIWGQHPRDRRRLATQLQRDVIQALIHHLVAKRRLYAQPSRLVQQGRPERQKKLSVRTRLISSHTSDELAFPGGAPPLECLAQHDRVASLGPIRSASAHRFLFYLPGVSRDRRHRSHGTPVEPVDQPIAKSALQERGCRRRFA